MEPSCFQCFVSQSYLTALDADFTCPDCQRQWRPPRDPPPSSSNKTKQTSDDVEEPPELETLEPESQPEAHVFMCSNVWCDYFCESNEQRSYLQVKNMLINHKKSCDLNWKKKRVFQRKGKVGGYFVPQKKKAELKRKANEITMPDNLNANVKLEKLDDL